MQAPDNELLQGLRVTLLGCGRMGMALLSGWLATGIDPRRLQVIEPHPSNQLLALLDAVGCELGTVDEAGPADVLVVAVKPQAVADVAAASAHLCAANSMVVSIMAGSGTARLRELFPAAASTVRTMPNLAAMSGESATVLFADPRCSAAHRDVAEALMACVGSTQWLPDEAMMDAACALSSSGPAYVFHPVECLASAGIAEGLPDGVAWALARQTVVGAGKVLSDGDTSPADLRRQVTSPGGTTEAGLLVLMGRDAMAELVGRTVEASANRSRELGA